MFYLNGLQVQHITSFNPKIEVLSLDMKYRFVLLIIQAVEEMKRILKVNSIKRVCWPNFKRKVYITICQFEKFLYNSQGFEYNGFICRQVTYFMSDILLPFYGDRRFNGYEKMAYKLFSKALDKNQIIKKVLSEFEQGVIHRAEFSGAFCWALFRMMRK